MSHGASGNLLGDAVPLLAEFSKSLACAHKYRCVRNDTRHACQNSQDRFAPSATCTWSASLQPNARSRPTSACGAGTRNRASPNSGQPGRRITPEPVVGGATGGFVLHPTPVCSQRTNRNRANQRGSIPNNTLLRRPAPSSRQEARDDIAGFLLTRQVLVRRRWLKRRSSICT